ncbi:MAG TPA: GFA family protein, partial [Polyangiaceae bacterium]
VKGEPKRFRSSNTVQRGFCGECGTPLTYEPDGFHPEVTIATLDDPSGVPPVIQVGLEGRLPWFTALAELPTRSPEEAARVAPFFDGIVSYQHPDR